QHGAQRNTPFPPPRGDRRSSRCCVSSDEVHHNEDALPASSAQCDEEANVSTRRTILRLGAGALVAGGAAAAWRAWDQGVFSTGQGPAYEPWNTWNGAAPRSELRLVHAAILSANPHNTQPWRFRVRAESIELFADPARNIGAIDPFRREMHMGLGCALENLLQAAAAT